MARDSDLSQACVILIDDDTSASNALLKRLRREEPSFLFSNFETADEGVAQVLSQSPEVVVVDIELDPSVGPESGLSLIRRIFNQDPTTRILALTGHSAGEVGTAALKAGAASFLQKPAELPHLLALIRDGVAYSRLKRSYLELQNISGEFQNSLGLTSRSPKMLGVLQQIQYAATSSIPVLLLGETGTGKGVVARAIHGASSRARHHFIRLQPQYGSPEMAASELFGHTKGAFTGAVSARQGLLQKSNRGTLFLDEVTQLPIETQVALLEVLQEGVYRPLGSSEDKQTDVRLISASNLAEADLVSDSALRQDFYHRIAHCTITLPPLRDRSEDISDLANLFLTQLVQKEELPVDGFTREALVFLEQQKWPGNIRQLQAAVESSVYKAAFHQQQLVELKDLQGEISSDNNNLSFSGSLRQQVKEFELSLVKNALAANDNNQSKAAQSLKIDRSSFRRILNREN